MADADVRSARSGDVDELARIHRDTWRTAYTDLLPDDVLVALDATPTLSLAVESGQLLVATEGRWLVGYCLAGGATEADTADVSGTPHEDAATTAIVTVLVEPRWGRRGHGSRLLDTAARQLVEAGATRGIAWIPESDRATRNFFERHEWTPDGTVRTLDAGGRPVREIRVSRGLTPLSDA
ncbi:GNAT family N-acetyltransferase [Saccharothrix violaceirubra]|uniref:GNAT superfamily N-acetyltransferase n=1 Tax=Saccharothrix violaceirubra TaxID=413306 RepID=A0A7W7SZX8_9PSEU|nr:GNAT family N-acetyltransferase [Saccharothrix violaceirubra]MBB4964057.1 GNAT superfamily N-acetyltransferase [Saccharothrix violaceirubra]